MSGGTWRAAKAAVAVALMALGALAAACSLPREPGGELAQTMRMEAGPSTLTFLPNGVQIAVDGARGASGPLLNLRFAETTAQGPLARERGGQVEVGYRGMWGGAELWYRQTALGPKYEIEVPPGFDLPRVRLVVEGASALRVLGTGELEIRAGILRILDTPPRSWDASGAAVDCAYVVHSAETFGFSCADWDSTRALTIDPLLLSTFIGGSQRDEGQAVALDGQGRIVVVGWTNSTDFPITAFSPDQDELAGDAFVARFTADGETLEFATYFGGSGYENGLSVAIDAASRIWFAGQTNSPDLFTTADAAQQNASGGTDGFLARLSADGRTIEYASYLGGAGWDRALGIALDRNGDPVLTGETNSSAFPVPAGACNQNHVNETDAFVARFNRTTGAIEMCAQLGGTAADSGRAVAVDPNNLILIVGSTNSSDFPVTPNPNGTAAMDPTYNGGFDAFVAAIPASNTNGTFQRITYLGGAGDDFAYTIALDGLGNPFVGGITGSADFPITASGFQQTTDAAVDGFIVKMTAEGASITAGTFLGDDGNDGVIGLTVGASGDLTAVGFTDSIAFPVTQGALRTTLSGSALTPRQDAFFLRATADLSQLQYASFMGEAGVDIARSVAVDASGAAIVVGGTDAAGFPTTNNAFDRVLSQSEAFLFRAPQRRPLLSITTDPPGRSLLLSGATVVGPYSASCDESVVLPVIVDSPQTLGGTRYLFSAWSDAALQDRTISCTADTALALNFTAEVLISLASAPTGLNLRFDGADVTAPWTSWVPQGSVHSAAAADPLAQNGTRYLFDGWADGGPTSRILTAATPVSVLARYTPDAYSFDLISDPPGLTASVDGVNFTCPAELWLAIGSTHEFGAPSPQPGGTGLRYAFAQWSDGLGQSHAVAAGGPTQMTVSFGREFEIVLDSEPPGLAVLVDGAVALTPWSAWRANGTGISLAPPADPPILGGTMYGAMAWSDGGASTRSWSVWRPERLTALFQPVAYELRLVSSPEGVPLTLDGSTENAALSFQPSGANFSVGAPVNYTNGSTRYTFVRWSDVGEPTHFATVNGPLTLTAFFSRTFEIRFNATPADARFHIDGVEFTGVAVLWMSEGSVHQLTAAESIAAGASRRLAFVSWSDGESAAHAYTASAPVLVELVYQPEVFLTVDTEAGDPTCDIPNCWYPVGATAIVTVKSPWNESGGRRQVIRGWLGNDSASNNSASKVMNGPALVKGIWANQFFLAVASRFATVEGGGWYDEGVGAAFAVSASEATAGGTRYRFTGWSGDVLSTSTDGLVFMDGPKSVVAVWGEVGSPVSEGPLWIIVPSMVAAAGFVAALLARRRRAARKLERAWKSGDEWLPTDAKGQP